MDKRPIQKPHFQKFLCRCGSSVNGVVVYYTDTCTLLHFTFICIIVQGGRAGFWKTKGGQVKNVWEPLSYPMILFIGFIIPPGNLLKQIATSPDRLEPWLKRIGFPVYSSHK